MTEPVWDCGYLSFPPEIQAACEAPPGEGRNCDGQDARQGYAIVVLGLQ